MKHSGFLENACDVGPDAKDALNDELQSFTGGFRSHAEAESRTMTDEVQLLSLALTKFAESWATQSIPEKVRRVDYDRSFAQEICTLMFRKCGNNVEKFKSALNDFILLSEEFVRLQFDLERTGKYKFSSFEEVRSTVYDNAALMDSQYLNGLLLSQAFWVNHSRIHAYFLNEFCSNIKPSGSVFEVPTGSGIYLAEFARRNSRWTAKGMDLSQSSVAFSSEIARLSKCEVAISQGDVLQALDGVKFDRIICGELLEHLEAPEALLQSLLDLLAKNGRIFLTTAIWAAAIDHIYLFRSAWEVRSMLEKFFTIKSELVLNIRDNGRPDEEKTPINYACILTTKT